MSPPQFNSARMPSRPISSCTARSRAVKLSGVPQITWVASASSKVSASRRSTRCRRCAAISPPARRAELEQSLMGFFRYQAELGRDSARRAGGEIAAQRLQRVERLEALTFDEALATQVICGTPDSFTARLRAVQEEIGLDGILAELNCGGLIPHDGVMRALQLMCEEVKPRFH